MADENRMVTFNYAKNTWDAFKKQTIPNTLECMTKTDILNYLNVDVSFLSSYGNNQLIPRNKIVGQSSFTIVMNPTEQYYNLETGSTFTNQINYQGGSGKYYAINEEVMPWTTKDGVTYKVKSTQNQTISGNGVMNVEIQFYNWSGSSLEFIMPITVLANTAGTISATTNLLLGRYQ